MSISTSNLVSYMYIMYLSYSCLADFIQALIFIHYILFSLGQLLLLWMPMFSGFMNSRFTTPARFTSYLATFLGTNILSVLMCRKAVNQSINQSIKSCNSNIITMTSMIAHLTGSLAIRKTQLVCELPELPEHSVYSKPYIFTGTHLGLMSDELC